MQAAGLVLTSYQESLTRAMDVVANNVSNANTTGFKRQEIQFDSLIVRSTNEDKLTFAADRGTFRNTAQGPMLTTGNPLDVAIQGAGYFPIQTANGTYYTRAGVFMLNGSGEIVTGSGDKLLGDGDQPITLPDDASDIHITADGVITAKSGAGTDVTQVGKLKIVKFDREQEMQVAGNGLYSTSQQPQTDTDSRIVQGMIERSNVESVNEITNMIKILRSYQQTVHLLEKEHQRQTDSINKLSKATA